MDLEGTQNTNDGAGGAAGGQQTSGLTQIPENLRGHEAFAGYKAMSDLWQGHIDLSTKAKDLESRLANSIPKLAENATEEQKAMYRAAMGIPSKAEEYDIPVQEGDSGELANAFRQFAFDAGMPKDMAKKTAEWWNGFIGNVQKASDEFKQREHDVGMENLKKRWGADYDKNAEIVKRAFTALKGTENLDDLLLMQIGGTPDKPILLGNHPLMMSVFYEIGKKVTPDTMIPGRPQQGTIKEGIIYDKSPAPPKQGG